MPDNSGTIRCADCDEDLTKLGMSGEKSPCPNCGSAKRIHHKTLRANIQVSSHLSRLGKRDGEVFLFGESERQGRISSAELDKKGLASFSLKGSSPQGEEDTLLVCRILVESLNLSGTNWESPILGAGVVDCMCTNQDDPSKILSLQVIRAISDQAIWRELSATGEVVRKSILVASLVPLLEGAIKSKASDTAIPRVSRSGLTLVLDANRLPILGFDFVEKQAKKLLGSWAAELGFESVWLVGPTPQLTFRLDEPLDK